MKTPTKLSDCRHAADVDAYLDEFFWRDPEVFLNFAKLIFNDRCVEEVNADDERLPNNRKKRGEHVDGERLPEVVYTVFNRDKGVDSSEHFEVVGNFLPRFEKLPNPKALTPAQRLSVLEKLLYGNGPLRGVLSDDQRIVIQTTYEKALVRKVKP